jgi:hypothetical protein
LRGEQARVRKLIDDDWLLKGCEPSKHNKLQRESESRRRWAEHPIESGRAAIASHWFLTLEDNDCANFRIDALEQPDHSIPVGPTAARLQPKDAKSLGRAVF